MKIPNLRFPGQATAEQKLQAFGRKMGINGAKFVKTLKTKGFNPMDDNGILGKK